MLLTDTMFLFFFIVGIYFGLRTFRQNRVIDLVAYVGFTSVAAIIRPTLFLFPILNFSLALFIVKRYKLEWNIIWQPLIITTLILIVTCNLPTLRNYRNYSFFSPSSVVGLNAFRSVAQKIMINTGRAAEYEQLNIRLDTISDINQKTEIRKAIMKAEVLAHPIATSEMLLKNSINVFLDNHVVNNLGNYFGYHWKIYEGTTPTFTSTYSFKKSTLCLYLTYFWMPVYLLAWSMLAYFCYKQFTVGQIEYVVLVFTLLFIFIFPAIIIGDGGSRLRLPFEPFLIIIAIYQANQFLYRRKA